MGLVLEEKPLRVRVGNRKLVGLRPINTIDFRVEALHPTKHVVERAVLHDQDDNGFDGTGLGMDYWSGSKEDEDMEEDGNGGCCCCHFLFHFFVWGFCMKVFGGDKLRRRERGLGFYKVLKEGLDVSVGSIYCFFCVFQSLKLKAREKGKGKQMK